MTDQIALHCPTECLNKEKEGVAEYFILQVFRENMLDTAKVSEPCLSW